MKNNRNRRKGIATICIATVMVIYILVFPSSSTITPEELTTTLEVGESVSETKTVFVPSEIPKADVMFSFDLTGSMGGIINTAKSEAIDIMGKLDAEIDDANYGVISYMDYPDNYDSFGYASTYGSSGDYAYSLDKEITNDRDAVSTAINNLVLGYGADGPQDYTRIMYESYADPNIMYRDNSKKILLNFGDNVPHDNDLNEGVTTGTWSTGGDPGRDEIMDETSDPSMIGVGNDDLNLQTVLDEMAANEVTLLEVHTTTNENDYWKYWTGITGGDVYVTSGSGEGLADAIVTLIEAEATHLDSLKLVPESGYESWVITDPAEYTDVTIPEGGADYNFDIVITVPEETECGLHEFTISAMGNGANYGDQTVKIDVPCNNPPDVSEANPSLDCLWPPNHEFVDITIEGVTDPDGDEVTITVTGITSDEPTSIYAGEGNEDLAPDASIETDTASLRAERSGTGETGVVNMEFGNGRVYEITFVASDGNGGETEGSITVCVPHELQGKCDCSEVIDDGQIYDATQVN
jgi:hypothetical protein